MNNLLFFLFLSLLFLLLLYSFTTASFDVISVKPQGNFRGEITLVTAYEHLMGLQAKHIESADFIL